MIGFENKQMHSQRLSYRLLCDSDKPQLAEILREKAVTEPAGFLPAGSPEEFDAFFDQLTQYNTGIAVLLGQQLIGYFHVNKYVSDQEAFRDKKCVGVGFGIGREYQGNGYGTEMLSALTDYLLTVFDVCFADHFTGNTPSKRVIEKSGYSFLEEYSMFFQGLGKVMPCFSYYRRK